MVVRWVLTVARTGILTWTCKLSAEAVARWQRRTDLARPQKRREAAQSNRYLQRLIEDEELRASLLAAYGSARSAYGRMNNGKPADARRCSRTASCRRSSQRGDALRERVGVAARAAGKPQAPPPARPGRSLAAAHRRGACSPSPSARACARRCSTRCSAPRRSSTTARPPPRPTPAPAGVARG